MVLFLYSFIGIFVAMDVIGTLPVYLAITRKLEDAKREYVIRQSILVASAVAILFTLIGKWIFKFLGIALYDFQVGGGTVLLVMAILDLIHKRDADAHTGSTGVVPLGVPLITGPALITTLMLQVGLYGHIVVLGALLLNCLFTWLALTNSHHITRLIGEEGTDIVSKIAALLMTAIAFSMIRTGIFDAIKHAR